MLVKRPKSRIKDEEKPAYRVQAEQRFQEVRRVGRPPGARNKLSEAFIADLQAVWEDHGPKILQRMLVNEPEKLAELVAKLIPREFQVSVEQRVPGNLSADEWAILRRVIDLIQQNAKGAELGPVLQTIESALRADAARTIEAE